MHNLMPFFGPDIEILPRPASAATARGPKSRAVFIPICVRRAQSELEHCNTDAGVCRGCLLAANELLTQSEPATITNIQIPAAHASARGAITEVTTAVLSLSLYLGFGDYSPNALVVIALSAPRPPWTMLWTASKCRNWRRNIMRFEGACNDRICQLSDTTWQKALPRKSVRAKTCEVAGNRWVEVRSRNRSSSSNAQSYSKSPYDCQRPESIRIESQKALQNTRCHRGRD
jgi:hypothetical protein